MANINKIRLSGTSYDIEDLNATKVVDITQAAYDVLPSSAKTANILYNITDAEAIDISEYWTSAETQSAITEATSGKVSTSDFNTYSGSVNTALNSKASQTDLNTLSGTVTAHTANTLIHVSAEQIAAWNAKSDFSGSYNDLTNKLSAGTNISIVDNVISAEGGGGKAIEAGRGISIATGATADTISISLPISATTNENLIIGDKSNIVNDLYNSGKSIVFGRYSKVKSYDSLVGGYNCSNEKGQSQTFGNNSKAKNLCEFGCGIYNNSVSVSTTFGDSGNTLFSVGNGTADNARHNAFEIRQNGDIYLSLNGQDVKLQDHLGGGGSITVDPSLDSGSTNPVANSAITEAVNSKVNISDNNVSAFSDFKVALESGKDYTLDNISTFYLGTNKTTGSGTNDLVTITTTDVNYPTITINCIYSNGNIRQVRTTSGITSSVENGIAQITLTGGVLTTVVSASSGGAVFLYKQYTSGQTADVVEDTVYDALKELSNNKLDYIYKDETINSKKTFLWGSSGSDKPIIFKQTKDSAKIGFTCQNSASTNNEIATFEFRPGTYTDSSSVSHPLLYIGHYRNTNTANAGVVQTMVGFRQYDQKGAAAYHYLMPLPAEAKTPFSLTTSFKNYFAPLGFKNGSTMITTDNTGVADFSSVLGGLSLVKLTQAEYDALATKDSNVLYVIVG